MLYNSNSRKHHICYVLICLLIMYIAISIRVYAASPDTIVYGTESGKCYHADGCGSLWNSKIPITLMEAYEKNYTPCEKCILSKPENYYLSTIDYPINDQFDEEILKNSGSLGYSEKSLDALENGTYRDITNREPTVTLIATPTPSTTPTPNFRKLPTPTPGQPIKQINMIYEEENNNNDLAIGILAGSIIGSLGTTVINKLRKK